MSRTSPSSRPLNRPINLDELPPQAKYFPSLYIFAIYYIFLSPLSLCHVSRCKTLVIRVAAGFLLVCTAEWRNIYTGGALGAVCSLVAEAFKLAEVHVCRCIHTHAHIYIRAHIVVVTEGRGVPASQRQCVCVCVLWGGRGLL